MPHSAKGTTRDGYLCECRATFGSVEELDEHLVHSRIVHDEMVAVLAEVIEKEVVRVAEHNNAAPPSDWIGLDEMSFRVAEKLGKEYFMVRWGS